jgi:hypothetical protein
MLSKRKTKKNFDLQRKFRKDYVDKDFRHQETLWNI